MIDLSKVKPHRGHVDKVYGWCKKKYGRSKYNGRYPDVVFRKGDYYDGEEWGYYDEIDKTIYINRDKHETVEDLAHTIIHEYTHYLQSMHHYQILALYHEHDNHPLEIQAEEVANRDLPECLEYIKSLYSIQDSDIYTQKQTVTSDEDEQSSYSQE